MGNLSSWGTGRRVRGRTAIDGIHHHRKATHCDYRGISLLVLYPCVSKDLLLHRVGAIHLLKLVTGVDTSTRPVRRSGRPGNTRTSRIRTTAAPPSNTAFLLSTAISGSDCTTRNVRLAQIYSSSFLVCRPTILSLLDLSLVQGVHRQYDLPGRVDHSSKIICPCEEGPLDIFLLLQQPHYIPLNLKRKEDELSGHHGAN